MYHNRPSSIIKYKVSRNIGHPETVKIRSVRRLLGGSGGDGDDQPSENREPPPSPKVIKRRSQAERDRAELQELIAASSHSPKLKRKSLTKPLNFNFAQDPGDLEDYGGGATNAYVTWNLRQQEIARTAERELRESRETPRERDRSLYSQLSTEKLDNTPSVFVSPAKSSTTNPKKTSDNVYDYFPDVHNFIDVQHLPNVLSGLKEMYEDQDLVDVKLLVDRDEYPCHRVVLAASSPYFRAMFTHDVTESRKDQIRINGVESESMRLIIQYAYTSEVEINVENVQGLMLASNMFQLLNLRDACAAYMERHVTLTNCINIYFFASAHECGKLQDLARKLIYDKFNDVCKEEEFYNLGKEKLIDLISRDEINVDREEVVYEAVMTWVKRELEARKDDLMDVIKHVRFALLSPYFIHDCLERERLIYSHKPCQQLFEEALQYHLLKDRRPNLKLLSNMNTNTRRGMPFRDMVMFMTRNEISDFSIGNDNYRLRTLPDFLEHPETVVMGENQIFAAGKQHLDFSTRRMHTRRGGGLYQYDLFEKKWLSRAPMSYARTHFRLVAIDGLIYAVGGMGADGVLSSVEVYTPQTNSWRLIAPLPHALRGHCVVAFSGQLYVLGGECEDTILDSSLCYNPRTDAWSNTANMILPRCSAGVAVFNQEIYVVGGTVGLMSDKIPDNMLKSVEIYNPSKNEWRFGPELPEGRCNCQMVTYSSALYCMSGETGDEEVENRIWKLESEKSGWVDDRVNWPNVTPPYNCVVGRMIRDSS
ncbi:kelch repeat and BTB domain-containing protein 8-like [Glandiceps talaboti]